MYIGLTHNALKNRIFVLVIVAGCLVRLVTNYLYGLNYESPDAEWWAAVYYRGQQWFEMLVMIGAAMIVREYFDKKFYLTVAFFMDLSIFAWVKEYFLNPLEWQFWEFSGFFVSTLFLIIRLLISEKRLSVFRNKIKLIFR
jgi:hypothetical protein